MANPQRSAQFRPTIPVSGHSQVRRADDLAHGYRAHLIASCRSPRTRDEYTKRVAGFVEWAVATRRRRALSDEVTFAVAVGDYVRTMKIERHWSGATANLTVAALCHFGTWAGLGAPAGLREQLPRRAPRALSIDDEVAVLHAARRRGRREAAVVALMAFCGLRVGEVAALDRDDLVDDKVVVRAGKGGHWRSVPMPVAARRAVARWLAERPGGAGPLFPGRGRGLSEHRLCELVRECGHDCGVAVSPHALRHTFATRLVRAGVDLVVVAELLGHRDVNTARAYTLPSDADVARMVELAVPEEAE